MATKIGRSSYKSITALMSVMSVKWKKSGIVKVEGIPAPSGSYEVGCTHLMHQDLQIRLYYPTERDQATTYEYAKYFPHPKYIKALMDVIDIPLSGLASGIVRIFCIPRIPALLNAPLMQSSSMQSLQNNSDNVDTQDWYPPKEFPVVVFSHGLGSHFHHYSGICSDLASHGYVVAAVEHRDGSASLALKRVQGPRVKEGQYNQYVDKWLPYNKIMPLNDKQMPHANFSLRNLQVRQRAKEVGQALDILHLLNKGGDVNNMLGRQFDFTQFKGRLNMELTAVCGHSFGGSTVVQTLSEDPKFKCGIALDAWMFPLDEDIYTHGIHQPLIFINSFGFQWANNIACIMKLIRPASESETSPCTLYTLKGTTHLNQTDAPFTVPSTVPFTIAVPRTLKALKNSPLDKYVAHEVNMKICHAFLNRFLIRDEYHKDIVILDGREGTSDYILYGTNVDWEKEKNTRREIVSDDIITSSETLDSRT